MQEFEITYFFDENHYITRFVSIGSEEDVIALLASERDRYISFKDNRDVHHVLNTANVRVTQFSKYDREFTSE